MYGAEEVPPVWGSNMPRLENRLVWWGKVYASMGTDYGGKNKKGLESCYVKRLVVGGSKPWMSVHFLEETIAEPKG